MSTKPVTIAYIEKDACVKYQSAKKTMDEETNSIKKMSLQDGVTRLEQQCKAKTVCEEGIKTHKAPPGKILGPQGIKEDYLSQKPACKMVLSGGKRKSKKGSKKGSMKGGAKKSSKKASKGSKKGGAKKSSKKGSKGKKGSKKY